MKLLPSRRTTYAGGNKRIQQLKFESIVKELYICRFGRPDTPAVLPRHARVEPVLPSVGRNVQPGDDWRTVHNPSPHSHVRLRCVKCRGLFTRNIDVPDKNRFKKKVLLDERKRHTGRKRAQDADTPPPPAGWT